MGSKVKRDAFGNVKQSNKKVGYLLIGLISVFVVAAVLVALFVWPGLIGSQHGDKISITIRDSLNDYTWDEIQAIAKSGDELSKYNINVGDTKTTLDRTYVLVDDSRDGYYGGLVFMYNSDVSERMNNAGTNSGGYANADLKGLVDSMYEDMPSELQNAIKTVTIGSNDGAENREEMHYNDVKLFLPSVREVGFEVSSEQWYGNILERALDRECAEDGKYDYDKAVFDWFAGSDAQVNRSKMCSSSAWWLRSAMGMLDAASWFIDGEGNLVIGGSSGSRGVIPVFVIG